MPGFRFGAISASQAAFWAVSGIAIITTSAAATAAPRVEHPEAGLLGDRAALRRRRQAHDDVDARLAQVQRVGVALAAEPDDRDGLAGERRRIRVRVVVHPRRHRFVASSIDCAPRDITTVPVRTISLIP